MLPTDISIRNHLATGFQPSIVSNFLTRSFDLIEFAARDGFRHPLAEMRVL
jgi:hypothetical protein